MADPSKTDDSERIFSELLSPSELFAARSRSRKLPVRGQKDFYPSGCTQQKQRLQNSLDEHWELVSEERVERLGNLVRGIWNPSDQIVELQSPAGKFWQTMGFSADGKQCLQPEEALYLMECGNLQVFHRDLPLSIQEGYETFLSSSQLSLQQYQVFGHLKRLGYVVSRFHASSVPSLYERQLNLPPSRDRGANQLKRKRSPSPEATATVASSPRPSEKQEDSTNPSSAQDKATHHSQPSAAQQPIPEGRRPPADDDVAGRSWWSDGLVPPEQQQDGGPSPGGPTPRWDFLSIQFPDLGARDTPGPLAPPDPALLPGAMAVGVCSVSSWLRRLNTWREKQPGGKQRRRREEEEERARRRTGPDREVQGCRSWAEYRRIMERRRKGSRRSDSKPAHLWEKDVTPLHDPRQGTSTAELLEKISVVKPSRWADKSCSVEAVGTWQISFDVHQPAVNTEFRKSSPGMPYSRMCVCSFDGPVPALGELQHVSQQSGDVPVTMAVVDHGDISFYTFKHFLLPCDLPQ
ncbi:tRNA-splicing endonuclease subunit Sen54 isoform X1 [Gadus macrocephalus]|uniref:tRNA-splicing endonuclease subunit Sen54 isoform X1 n=2 Tax=Gadus macrocephalus TaxID=80720 RepID=UPI0028CB923F|nr:tRNA-splicing endonuclease subunit Sen54 isoform X1 [Gadus macrocephalus]